MPRRDADLDLAEARSSATTVPRATSPTRMSPLAVLAATPPPARSTVMSPLAALIRRSPVTAPIQLSPLEFFTTAGPSISRTCSRPEPVLISASAGDRVDVDAAGAGLEREPAGLRSSCTSPAPDLSRHAASRPVARTPPAAGLGLDVGAGRQVDRHVDRAGLAEQAEAALLGRLHQQPAVRVLDPGLLGGADVRVRAGVAGADLDDRVGAVGGDDPQVADDQLDGRR